VAVPQEPESAHEQYTTLSEYLESLLVTVILALFGTSFVVQAFKIPSPSMEKDPPRRRIISFFNKFILAAAATVRKLLPYRDLQRGDIIAQISLPGSSALREARHRPSRRSSEDRRPASLRQRQSIE